MRIFNSCSKLRLTCCKLFERNEREWCIELTYCLNMFTVACYIEIRVCHLNDDVWVCIWFSANKSDAEEIKQCARARLCDRCDANRIQNDLNLRLHSFRLSQMLWQYRAHQNAYNLFVIICKIELNLWASQTNLLVQYGLISAY